MTDWMRRHRPGTLCFGWLSGAMFMQGVMVDGIARSHILTALILLALAIQSRNMDRRNA